jgi:hypothetical protein
MLRLPDWKGKVQSQASAHLFPFLALVRKGVTSDTFTRYEEADDFEFYDAFFKVGDDADKPYYDPLNRKFRIGSHPHSNVATARKGTFERSWGAAESKIEDGITTWRLSANCADIVKMRVMTRGGETVRANVLDLAVWLFRFDSWPDDASSDTLLAKFREVFPLKDDAFDSLFEYVPEPAGNLFGDTKLMPTDVAGLAAELALPENPTAVKPKHAKPAGEEPGLSEDDPILEEVRALLQMGSSGIIFRGSPGTGKSWHAWNVALRLVNGRKEQVFRVQFHPAYGYEDLVEGYMPDEKTKSGFRIEDKVFLTAVEQARGTDDLVVFLVDEINRGDVARIFGELLTYIESGWREVEFYSKLSGRKRSIPRNLLMLATMNPHDRSITQLDMAMFRRFDHIDIFPSSERVSEFLLGAGMEQGSASLIVEWFDKLQKILPFGIGHTYFLNIGDVGKLSLVWRYRILPFCESILEFEPERLGDVKKSFDALDRRLRGAGSETA